MNSEEVLRSWSEGRARHDSVCERRVGRNTTPGSLLVAVAPWPLPFQSCPRSPSLALAGGGVIGDVHVHALLALIPPCRKG